MSLLLTPGFGEFGSYAQYHVAEESIVAVKPINLTHVEALAGRNRDCLITEEIYKSVRRF